VDYLSDCPSSRIRKVLADVPKTLDETYVRILREIKESHQEFAQMIFQCVAVASRPLQVNELAEVFTFDFEAGEIPEFHEDWREDDPVHAVLSACSSLLAVVNVKDTQVIQFSHFSVKEFLTSDRFPRANDTISDYHISMTRAHTLVTRVCLGTLLHLPENVTSDSLQEFPLAEYSGEHWIDHARFEDVSQEVEDGFQQLFDPRKSHLAAWVWIHDPETPSRTNRGKTPSGPRGTALHYAALCGLFRIVKFLITEHSQDVQASGFDNDTTPLHVASSRGHVEVARVLLEHSAVTTAQDKYGQTPLHRASSKGHLELALVLLEHGAVTTAQDDFGGTPLDRASSGGHLELVQVLLEHGPVATAQDKYGQTALLLASSGGHLEVARVLLEHGPVATAQDKQGKTPLHRASFRGHLELARVLLEHNAVATAQDKQGRTPLHFASSKGHLELARVLLEHGAVATAQDRNGSTPLHWASSKGHTELARVLLEHSKGES
jgi:ankyrin repeat protein